MTADEALRRIEERVRELRVLVHGRQLNAIGEGDAPAIYALVGEAGGLVKALDIIREEAAKVAAPGDGWRPASEPPEVEWVVNNIAELGVKIGDRFYWLYKGESLIYREPSPSESDAPIKWRPVGKREFGECVHPLHMTGPTDYYTKGDGWRHLPLLPEVE